VAIMVASVNHFTTLMLHVRNTMTFDLFSTLLAFHLSVAM
jgi:hypothetical protein